MGSSQANGVGASGWIVNGRAGGLGHGPLVPHLLAIVAAPESNSDIIVTGHRNGLLLEELKIKRGILDGSSRNVTDSSLTFSRKHTRRVDENSS